MTEKEAPAFIQCGRRVSAEEIEQIKETVELFPRLSLKELVQQSVSIWAGTLRRTT